MDKMEIKTGIAPEFISGLLTSDISSIASILDLIDNSIDGARSHMAGLGKKLVLDDYGMPSDYSNYGITIAIERDSFSIIDNCSGIDDDILQEHMFFIGKESSQQFGLGKYGIGLKRALFKLGNSYYLKSVNGVSTVSLSFDRTQLQNCETLEASVEGLSDCYNFELKISSLNIGVKREFSYSRWQEKLVSEIGIRYGLFLEKGLQINIKIMNGSLVSIRPTCPKISYNNDLLRPRIEHLAEDGVDIHIETGLHQDFTLNAEYGVNNHLSSEYGWTVLCNDRVIEFAKREGKDFGWNINWHSEYNGFVGYIRFYSKDVSKLPWDSTKTRVQNGSIIFLNIQEKIEDFTRLFRSEVKSAKSNSSETSNSPDISKSQAAKPKSQPSSGRRKPNARKGSAGDENTSHAEAERHTYAWKTLLPKTFPLTGRKQSLDNLILEAISLTISGFTHTCAIIYRTLMEAALKQFVYDAGYTDDVKNHYFNSNEGRRKRLSEEDIKRSGLTVHMITGWFIDHTHVYPVEAKKELDRCLRDLRGEHLPKMNGVVHSQNIIGALEVEQMRNETYHFLEFLISSISQE